MADTVFLDQAELHGSVTDPVLGSIGFLNEVMSRYPEAISFAPGAPHPAFFDDLDLGRLLDRFVEHLVSDRGWSRTRARRALVEYGPSRGLINHLVTDMLRGDFGVAAAPESVVVTVGAQEAMLLVLRALCRSADDVIAVANPCFVGITGAARLLDVPIVPVPETADGIDLDRLLSVCRETRGRGRQLRACYVAADFANPGGGRMSLACRQELLALAEDEDFLVLEDNVYGFTAADDAALPCLKALDTVGRVVHIGTFAKICFPGARVGFVVADQRIADTGRLLADELAALKSMVTVNTSPLGQAVIGGMLLDHGGSIAELVRPKAIRYRRNLGRLLAALDEHLPPLRGRGVGWNHPDGGFFVMVDLPVPVDLGLLERSADRHGVLWTPMAQFHLDGSGANRLRLSCSYLDEDDIDEGVRRLAAFLTEEVGR